MAKVIIKTNRSKSIIIKDMSAKIFLGQNRDAFFPDRDATAA